jgi:hypothetical protein
MEETRVQTRLHQTSSDRTEAEEFLWSEALLRNGKRRHNRLKLVHVFIITKIYIIEVCYVVVSSSIDNLTNKSLTLSQGRTRSLSLDTDIVLPVSDVEGDLRGRKRVLSSLTDGRSF